MKTVIFSLLGTQIDAGVGPERWNRWRPNVGLCAQEDFVVDRLELIHDRRSTKIASVVAQDIANISPETQVQRPTLEFKNPWDFEEVYSGLLDFVRRYPFDTASETYYCNLTTGTHVAQICWFLLTEAGYVPGKLIQASPPRGRDTSIAGHTQIIDLDLSKYDQIARRFAEEAQDGTSFLKSGIVTRNQAFNTMIDQIEKVVIRSDAPVMLLGPTGAGKSQLAERIYALKKARHQIDGPFVEVNCATLRGENAMSALFGHKKGAFTGAASDRKGYLRAAAGGLLFLDEIGELGLDEQAMILRAIEDKAFYPFGSDQLTHSDFQVIAGTNQDLRRAAREGRFRPDLLARLDMWTYSLPSLAERREDIEPNIDYELRRQATRLGTHVSFNAQALSAYLRFATSQEALWPGNFRDLNASIMRMVTLADGGRIDLPVAQSEIARLKLAWHGEDADAALEALLDEDARAALDPFDAVQLTYVIGICRRASSLSEAGRALFARSRLKKRSSNDADRLAKYLARFGLDWTRVRAG